MTRELKTAEEWSMLEKFRDLLDDFPKGKVIKTESPDFIVSLNRKKSIGIELSRLPGPSTPEVIREAILKKEDKLRLYFKKRLDNYWLILVTGPEDCQAIRRTRKLLESNPPSSPYHRIFLFNPGEKHIFGIK